VARRWTTASSKDQVDEFVLGYACERKDIVDLANGLNVKNKTTGLVRTVNQKLKMNNSGVEKKFYIVQGQIKDLFKVKVQSDIMMRKRVHEYIKTMEEDNYTVTFFTQDAVTQIVDFLRGIHQHVGVVGSKPSPPDTYMPLTAMIERADWVTELNAVRKSLAQGTLGEKKLQLILLEFPTSFETEYNRDSAAMVQRLASLETDKRRGITITTAHTLCTNLFGAVATRPRREHTPRAASVPVTPNASQEKRIASP
jgi:hypothetical protein